jgi:transmembrane sensor
MYNNNYENFGITDFVSDDAFLKHYLSPTDATTRFWTQWLEQNTHKHSEWQEARQLLEAVMLGLNDYARTYLSEENQNRLLERIQNTNALLEYDTPIVPLWRNIWVISTAAAACVLLVFGVWFLKVNKETPSVYEQQITALQQEVIEKTNTTTKPETIALPDGSTVILSPNSRVSYPSNFGQEARPVYLSGEAQFDVTKDVTKPFYVYANEVITKVLGTRFVVNSFDKDKNVKVTVQSGQVSVYRPEKTGKLDVDKQKKEGVLLLPNQEVVFERLTAQFKKSLISNPVLLEIPKEAKISFEFDETPVTEAFERLEKAYGIDIVFNKEALADCQITTSLNQETLFQKLNIITQIIGGTYETVDGQIVITAKRCR